MNPLVAELRLELLVGLILAVVLGGTIGLEREFHGKPAGLRTNILICLGSTLFTHLSLSMAGTVGDPARIAAQILTGVGFIGAGTIIHGRGSITGLTSAATIWLVAAIGMAIGFGEYLEAIGTTLLVFLVLSALGSVERFVARRGEGTTITVEMDDDPDVLARVQQRIVDAGLEIDEIVTKTQGVRLAVTIHMIGPRARQDAAKLTLLRTPGIRGVLVLK